MMRFSGSVAYTDNEELPKLNKSAPHKQFRDCGTGLLPASAAVAHGLPRVRLAS